jgi:hypothetical protein
METEARDGKSGARYTVLKWERCNVCYGLGYTETHDGKDECYGCEGVGWMSVGEVEWEDALADIEISDQQPHDAFAPDWSAAPDWAQWWAVDESGDAYWYKGAPNCEDVQWWAVGIAEAGSVDLAGTNWRTTLRQRPAVQP